MSQELIYTSAPAGLAPGSRGFCVVASTPNMPASLTERLEALSAYRHVFQPHDPNAALNPIAYSHLKLSVSGRTCHVLSRVTAAGVDYTNRTNKFAHHVVLDPVELPAAGPAWLLSQPGFMETVFNGPPRVLPTGRPAPRADQGPAVCSAWQQQTGDAGWGGLLAETAMDANRAGAMIIFRPGMNVLPLVSEAIALLPAEKRWDVTFTTYYTKLPPGIDCKWRFVLEGSPEAAARVPGALIIDLSRPLPHAVDNTWSHAARSGTALRLKSTQTTRELVGAAPPVRAQAPPPGFKLSITGSRIASPTVEATTFDRQDFELPPPTFQPQRDNRRDLVLQPPAAPDIAPRERAYLPWIIAAAATVLIVAAGTAIVVALNHPSRSVASVQRDEPNKLATPSNDENPKVPEIPAGIDRGPNQLAPAHTGPQRNEETTSGSPNPKIDDHRDKKNDELLPAQQHITPANPVKAISSNPFEELSKQFKDGFPLAPLKPANAGLVSSLKDNTQEIAKLDCATSELDVEVVGLHELFANQNGRKQAISAFDETSNRKQWTIQILQPEATQPRQLALVIFQNGTLSFAWGQHATGFDGINKMRNAVLKLAVPGREPASFLLQLRQTVKAKPLVFKELDGTVLIRDTSTGTASLDLPKGLPKVRLLLPVEEVAKRYNLKLVPTSNEQQPESEFSVGDDYLLRYKVFLTQGETEIQVTYKCEGLDAETGWLKKDIENLRSKEKLPDEMANYITLHKDHWSTGTHKRLAGLKKPEILSKNLQPISEELQTNIGTLDMIAARAEKNSSTKKTAENWSQDLRAIKERVDKTQSLWVDVTSNLQLDYEIYLEYLGRDQTPVRADIADSTDYHR